MRRLSPATLLVHARADWVKHRMAHLFLVCIVGDRDEQQHCYTWYGETRWVP